MGDIVHVTAEGFLILLCYLLFTRRGRWLSRCSPSLENVAQVLKVRLNSTFIHIVLNSNNILTDHHWTHFIMSGLGKHGRLNKKVHQIIIIIYHTRYVFGSNLHFTALVSIYTEKYNVLQNVITVWSLSLNIALLYNVTRWVFGSTLFLCFL